MASVSLALGDSDPNLWPDEGQGAFPHNLVFKPTWNFKGELRFLSLRKWLIRYKHDQAQEFRRLKVRGEKTPANVAVADCLEALSTFGNLKGFSVVPAPVGRSGSDSHFASVVGRNLAADLGIDFAPVLTGAAKRTKGVVSELQAKLDVRASRVPTHVILFDDVATTGATLQGCANALKGAFVLPIAWIFQESQPLWSGDPLFPGGDL